MFDWRTSAMYGLLAGMMAASLGFALYTGIRFSSPLLVVPQAWFFLLLVGAWLARRVGHSSIAGAFETIALAYFGGLAAIPLLLSLIALSGPFVDPSLASADRLIGFNWLAVVSWFKDKPAELHILTQLYRSFIWQPALVLIIMWLIGLGDRAWKMVTASMIALFICCAIFPFAPATGGFIHFGIAPEEYPNLHTTVPWRFLDTIEAIRAGTRLITRDMMAGYVTFPSYHAVMAAMFAWALWPSKIARWPTVVLNVGMAFSAIIIGAHYLVDVLAGIMVAGLSVRCAEAIVVCRPHSESIDAKGIVFGP